MTARHWVQNGHRVGIPPHSSAPAVSHPAGCGGGSKIYVDPMLPFGLRSVPKFF